MTNPFKTKKAMMSALREYEAIRQSGKVNMYSLGSVWGRKELAFIMDLYRQGIADKLLKL